MVEAVKTRSETRLVRETQHFYGIVTKTSREDGDMITLIMDPV